MSVSTLGVFIFACLCDDSGNVERQCHDLHYVEDAHACHWRLKHLACLDSFAGIAFCLANPRQAVLVVN